MLDATSGSVLATLDPGMPTALAVDDDTGWLYATYVNSTNQYGILTGNGSVAIFEVVVEGNGDGSGRRYPLQWFENGRLEYHPEAAHTRYAFELGLLGLQALRARVGP
jgi:hypothetical protein